MLACFEVSEDQWCSCTYGHQTLQTACSDRGIFTDGVELPLDRRVQNIHTFKLYRISAVTFFAKYVCKKEHGMFKSILNFLKKKILHENKVLVNRKVWVCSIGFGEEGVLE